MLTSGRQHVPNEDEYSLLGAELDALADDIHKLAHRQVGGHEVPASRQFEHVLVHTP